MSSDPEQHRNSLLRAQDDAIAEQLAAALRSGELQSAESYGKPLKPDEGWDQTPLEFRLPFKILKNADMAPPELALFGQRARLRARLREHLAQSADTAERQRLQAELAELEQRLALRLEGLGSSGRL